MKVDIKAYSLFSIEIDEYEAFKMLLKTLHMECVLNDDEDFFVRKDCHDNNCVYHIIDGHDEVYDDRGDLFVALRNVAVNMYSNLAFRGDDYIYKR